MNDIKFRYRYKDNEYYLVENIEVNNNFSYPLFNTKKIKEINNIEILNYPLNVIKINKSNKYIEKIKEKFLKLDKSNYIKEYIKNENIYLVFLNKEKEIKKEKNLCIFPNGLREFNELGCFYLDKKLRDEIFEIDQNLQSCISIELMVEIMELNSDMNKYIPLIKEEIDDTHLEGCFFFDAYVYELFSKVYIEVMEDNKVFDLIEMEEFIKEFN